MAHTQGLEGNIRAPLEAIFPRAPAAPDQLIDNSCTQPAPLRKILLTVGFPLNIPRLHLETSKNASKWRRVLFVDFFHDSCFITSPKIKLHKDSASI